MRLFVCLCSLLLAGGTPTLVSHRFHLTFNATAPNGTNHGLSASSTVLATYQDPSGDMLFSQTVQGSPDAAEFISTPTAPTPSTFAVANATVAFKDGQGSTLQFKSTGSGGVSGSGGGWSFGAIQFSFVQGTGRFSSVVQGVGANTFMVPPGSQHFAVHLIGVLFTPVNESQVLFGPSASPGGANSAQTTSLTAFALTFRTKGVDGVNHGSANVTQRLGTRIGPDVPFGIETDTVIPSVPGPSVAYTSKVSSPTPSTFTEAGTLSFPSGDSLSFNSTGSGGVTQSNSEATFGSIQYAITGGTGKYAGHVGAMMDYFVSDSNATDGAFDIVTFGFHCKA